MDWVKAKLTGVPEWAEPLHHAARALLPKADLTIHSTSAGVFGADEGGSAGLHGPSTLPLRRHASRLTTAPHPPAWCLLGSGRSCAPSSAA